jgi:hypothetical protein
MNLEKGLLFELFYKKKKGNCFHNFPFQSTPNRRLLERNCPSNEATV